MYLPGNELKRSSNYVSIDPLPLCLCINMECIQYNYSIFVPLSVPVTSRNSKHVENMHE